MSTSSPPSASTSLTAAATDASSLRAALSEAGLVHVAGPLPDIAHLMQDSGLVSSLSEARRAIADGGAYLNNERVTDPEYVPGAGDLLFGSLLLLRRGKRTIAGVELLPA